MSCGGEWTVWFGLFIKITLKSRFEFDLQQQCLYWCAIKVVWKWIYSKARIEGKWGEEK